MGNLLTQRAVVLAKIESTYGVDAAPSASVDAILVDSPLFSGDATVLNRNFVRNDLSPLPHVIGRIVGKLGFTTELRGNGLQNSGNTANAPILGRLLRACGFAETGVSGANTVGAAQNATGNTVNPTWVNSGTSVLKDELTYRVTCVLAGASATAKLRVTCDANGSEGEAGSETLLRSEDFLAAVTSAAGTVTVDKTNPLSVTYTVGGTWVAGDVIYATVGGIVFAYTVVAGQTTTTAVATGLAALIDVHGLIAASANTGVVTCTFAGTAAGVVVTSGTTSISLGSSGGSSIPTFAGSLVLGDSWTFTVTPVGIKYTPVSSGFESVTLYCYYDGKLHKLTGCRGTFSIQAPGGDYAKVSWEFTGNYVAPTDVALPTATYEQTLPAQVELARLMIDGFAATCAAWNYTQANQVSLRQDANSPNAYNGVRITGRNPTGGIDPEDELVGVFDFWKKLKDAKQMAFTTRVGQTAGNMIVLKGPAVQFTGLTYRDRDSGRVFDAGLKFNRVTADDEVKLWFC